VFIWEWDERAVVYKNGILLSNTQPYLLNLYESQVGPWRNDTLPWYNLMREVYAPIRIDAAPDGGKVRVQVRNQYDFTDLGPIKITWKLSSVDAAAKPKTILAQGDTDISLPPRSVRSFYIEVPSVAQGGGGSSGGHGAGVPGAAQDWRVVDAQLQSEGKVIGSRRLYLAPTETAPSIPTTPVKARPAAESKAGPRELAVGNNAATFDGRGQLLAVRTKDRKVPISGLVPNLWITPPGASMGAMSDAPVGVSLGGFPDRAQSLDGGPLHFDPVEPEVKRPDIAPAEVASSMHLDRAGSPISLETHATVTREGVLIRYRLAYCGQTVAVPAVGIRLELPASFSSWKWRGRGPWATYPNLTYAANPGVYEAPIVKKRRVGPSIPMAEEPLIGQWEQQGGTKSEVDRFWLRSPKATLEIVLGRRAFVECERVRDRVEVRINARVAELGDRQVPLEGCEGELLIRWPR
jgi:beta-galactosidase